jgi:O-antigen/teichoic acid export membrane protein
LVSFFDNLKGIWDPSVSIAFFTKLSRRNNDIGLYRFFSLYTIFVGLAILGGIWFVNITGNENFIWPNEKIEYVILAGVFSYLAWVSEIFRKITDAMGLTVSGEIVIIFMRFVGAVIVLGLFYLNSLNLYTLFTKEIIVAVLTIAGLFWFAKRFWNRNFINNYIETPNKGIKKEFWEYCSPMIIYAIISMITGVADRWILQTFSGGEQQGFFGLSYRIASVSFIFSVAITQLLQREFSQAFGSGNIEMIRHLFRRYIPLLYVTTTFIAAFICIKSESIVFILGGEKYESAAPAMMLMALYPIHQTYGQLSGSLFLATDKTKQYRNLGIITMIIGVVAVLVILLPTKYGGFAAGSGGLALKMIVVQFIGVNLQLWFNLKYLELSFYKFLWHQIYIISLFLCLAILGSTLTNSLHLSPYYDLFLSGILYSLFITVAIFLFPKMIGFSRLEIIQLFNKVLQKRLKRNN